MGFLKSRQRQELMTTVTFDSAHHVFHETILQVALNAVINAVTPLCDPMDYSPPRLPLFTGFSRHEYWSGLPCPPPRDLPNPGIKPASLTLASRFFTLAPPGKPDVSEYLEGTRSRIFTQNPSVMTWHLFLQQVCFLKVQSCQVLTAQITVFNKKGG